MNGRSKHSGFTLVEALVVIGIISVLAGLLLPVLFAAKRQANKDVCLSNLKQLGHSIQLYCTDHDDKLPYGPGPITKGVIVRGGSLFGDPLDSLIRELPDIRGLLAPYGAIPALFRCPMDQNWAARMESGHQPTYFQEFGSSYEYRDVLALGGRALGGFPAPAENLLMGDAEFFHGGMGPKDGLVNELFADFHVKTVTWVQRTKMLDSDK